jgi:hypothetical protein
MTLMIPEEAAAERCAYGWRVSAAVTVLVQLPVRVSVAPQTIVNDTVVLVSVI